MVKRIYQGTTWVPCGCIFSTVQFSRGIHVLSIWIQLPLMSGYPLKNQRVLYLRGSDVDFTVVFIGLLLKKKVIIIIFPNSDSLFRTMKSIINSDRI